MARHFWYIVGNIGAYCASNAGYAIITDSTTVIAGLASFQMAPEMNELLVAFVTVNDFVVNLRQMI